VEFTGFPTMSCGSPTYTPVSCLRQPFSQYTLKFRLIT
jgi:hypothetical protein